MKVVLYPEPVLLRPAEPVAEIDDAVRERAAQMLEVMKLERGVGLAAPQVDWGVRLLLASPDGETENTQVLINPRIVWQGGGKEWGEEGCLSFPGVYGEVLRHLQVKVEAQDLDGEHRVIEAEGFLARVIQHEIDHIDGIVFTSKMRPVDKSQNKARIDELVQRFQARSSSSQDQ